MFSLTQLDHTKHCKQERDRVTARPSPAEVCLHSVKDMTAQNDGILDNFREEGNFVFYFDKENKDT